MDDISSLTPAEATAQLNALEAASNPPPPIEPADSQDARARLDILSRDASWSQALFSGDGAARKQFDALVAAAADADTVGDAIAGIEEPQQQIFETTVGGQLPSRVVREVISGMRDAGLSDGVIEQALRGDPVSATEYAATRSLQAARHSDPAWVKALLSGSWSENREHQLMSIILSSPIAELK